MIKYGKLILISIFVCIFISGCKENEENKLEANYYGNELYNASYAQIKDTETLHIIPLLSKKNMLDIVSVQLESNGGEYDLSYTVEDGIYDYENYHLYNVCLKFSNVKFEKDKISVSSIDLIYPDKSKDTLKLDKCEIEKIDGTFDSEIIYMNGTPLKLPSDTNIIALSLSAIKNAKVTNIYLTNDDMKLNKDITENGEKTDQFDEFTLNTNEKYWSADFTVGNEELDQYKNYGTTIIVEFVCDGKKYYSTAAIPRTIYNPFGVGYDGIEDYLEYLKK